MNGKKLFISLLVSGLTLTSGIQLYATALSNESIKTNTVYTLSGSSAAASNQTEAEQYYNDKAFEALEKYFNLPRNKFPKDCKFTVFIMNKESLDQHEAHWYSVLDQELAQKKITQEEYKKEKESLKKEYSNYRARVQRAGYTIVNCQYRPSEKGDWYTVNFNGDTKELTYVSIPITEKGDKMLSDVIYKDADPCNSPESDAQKQAAALAFIQRSQIGGIQTPEFIKLAGPMHTRFYFQDANDHNKKVLIFFDPGTKQVYSADLVIEDERIAKDH